MCRDYNLLTPEMDLYFAGSVCMLHFTCRYTESMLSEIRSPA